MASKLNSNIITDAQLVRLYDNTFINIQSEMKPSSGTQYVATYFYGTNVFANQEYFFSITTPTTATSLQYMRLLVVGNSFQ